RRLRPGTARRRSAHPHHARARLLALSPAATLARGYAIVQRDDDGVVRDAASVEDGEALVVRLAEGRLGVTVTERHIP
ncbi:exodeoxyribonuclease VII large subunit, partial [Spirillospora sp. NPDC049652]